MNTASSKTKHSNKFAYNFIDKLNLRNPNKNIALTKCNKVFITHGKMSNQIIITINLKYQHPRGTIRLICVMVLIQLQLFKVILNKL